MKNSILFFAAGICLFTGFRAKAQDSYAEESKVTQQLSSKPVSAGLSIPKLLNARGNENLKAFFFTPIKNKEMLKGKRIAVIAADGFEEIEMLGPVWYFKALGATVDVIGPTAIPAPERYGLTDPEMSKDHVMAIQYLTPVGWVKIDHRIDEIKVADYDAIFIPGGAWNPDNLRYDKNVIKFVQDFFHAGKLTAGICHAPEVFASADILRGKKVTSYWNIQADVKNAGGVYSDVPVMVDGNLITSRHPIDVADFSKAVAAYLVKH